MKVITLLPIRNEAWILPHTLKNFSSFSDVIIVADQNSQDGSKDICKQFEKVRVIENTLTGHSNQVRWMLLDEARMIPGNNLIVCLDADEMIDPRFVDEITSKAQPGQGFSSQWLQLWNAGKSYRTDGPWKDARKVFAFWDDRTTNYLREEVVNDHTGRIPQTESIIEIDSPILHLQYLATKRCETKQIWYMCQELMQGGSSRRINNKYAASRMDKITSQDLNKNKLENIDLPTREAFESEDTDRLAEIKELFDQKGMLYFEGLDIWYKEGFETMFENRYNRKPRIKRFPWIILWGHSVFLKIRNSLK